MPRINTNIQAMLSAGALKRTERSLTGSLEKLSTGMAINRSSDNAAGLSISEQLRSQMRGLNMGNRNINDGIALLNIADGALTEVQNILQRMRELAIQASTGTVGPAERSYIQNEVEQLTLEIDRIASVTKYNKRPLLNGEAGTLGHPDFNPWGDPNVGGIIHIGANNVTEGDASDLMVIRFRPVTTDVFGLTDKTFAPGDPDYMLLRMDTPEDAQSGIGKLDYAIDYLSTLRSDIGAYTNRLEHALDNQTNMVSNVSNAESQIRHADFAKESTEFVRLQILQQASTSILAQANSLPNNILGLLNR